MNKENRRRFLMRLLLGSSMNFLPLSFRRKSAALRCDVLVVGAGSAGIPCAMAAAARGLKVFVIEKDSKIGGTLNITAGQMSAAGTRLQRSKGIEDSPERHFEEVMHLSNGTADPNIVRLAVAQAPRLIEWLETIGYPMADEAPAIVYNHPPYSCARTYWGKTDYNPVRPGEDAGKSLLKTFLPLWENYLQSGSIRLFTNTKLERLITKSGKVRGAIARQKDNSLLSFVARHTVLATGGYAANADFFRRVTPQAPRLISSARSTSQGEGIIAAMQIGAAFRNAEKHNITVGGIELQPQSGRADFWSAWARISTPSARTPREVYVNNYGLRFMAEDEPDINKREKAIASQPEQKCWLIFDETALSAGAPIVLPWTTARIRDEAQKGGCLWQANSIEELAQKTGLPTNHLTATIQQYNQAVQKGIDEQFGSKSLQFPVKQPPFYALLTYGFSLVSFGGLHTDAQLRVLDTSARIIEGLYAVGEILGAAATTGNVFCSGMLLTPAVALGRWLGEHLGNLGS
ncbi:MAG: FAD-dependent oxidoreductase [Cytophagales bacterium]|nr:FAD-dependent oxidoreductase [Bernardetiaceae bacterium]MDW8205686.1 FAD-dependent oxidoreductase [Cytophagales bacterium]